LTLHLPWPLIDRVNRNWLWLLSALVAVAPRLALAQDAYGGAVEREEIPDAGHTPVLTKPPQLLQTAEPVYPEEAKADKLTGDVVMQVDILADGKVGDVQVLQGAGHGFDEAAVDAVKQYVFSPAEIDNQPAPVRIQYTLHFVYKEPPPPEVDAGPTEVDGGASTPPPPQYPIAIKGHILQRASRKPIVGAAVMASFKLEPTAPETKIEPVITGVGGEFELRLPPGEITINVTDVNHHPYTTHETIKPAEQLEVTYFLMPKAYGLYETVVRGERDQKEVSRHTLTQEELEKVPGSMGDPIRVLQDLPGVARAPFLSGALIVRGADPGDTGSYLDGVEIPQLFHFLGGPSVINPEFLDRIDFYPGGFGSEYGRAIGGIVDVQTRGPKGDDYHGSGKIDLIDTGVFLSAPVVDGLTVSAAARRSYIDSLLPGVLPLFTNAAVVVAPRYYDYQLRADYKPPSAPKNTFKIFGFGSDDNLTAVASGILPGGATYQINNHISFGRLVGSWTYKNDKFSITTEPFGGWNQIGAGIGTFNFDDHDTVYGWRENLEYAFNSHFILRGGIDFELTQSHYIAHFPALPLNFRPFPGEMPARPPQSLAGEIDEFDYGEWFEAELRLPARIKIFPGVRVDEWRLHGYSRFNVDPRLIARVDLGDVDKPYTVKGSIGLYSESPGAQNLDPLFGNPLLSLQNAFQSSLGVEHKFSDVINVDVTAFYNRRYDLAEATNELVPQPDGSLKRVLADSIGLGRAYGVEVFLRHEITKHFFGWVAYTLSWSEQKNRGDPSYTYSDFDQRHILTVIAQYKFGNGWEVGGRFRLSTGVPTTPIVGSTFDSDTQGYDEVDGKAGSAREPAFHQLDLRVDKSWLFDRWSLGVYLDVQNVYNHLNQEGVIYDYRFQTNIVVPDIPILPTLGVKGQF
jgi:TonB family protein